MVFWRTGRLGPGEIIILIAIGVLGLVVITGHHKLILDTLYSPYTAFLAVVMLIEYLLLKGSDRTALYRRELEAARAKRRDDLLALRAIETQLVEMRAEINELNRAADDADRARTEPIQSRIEATLELLRSRI